MRIKLIADAAGRVHQIKTGDTDRLFDLVMSLSDYAHEHAMPQVAMKLEEVLDTIIVMDDGKQTRAGDDAYATANVSIPAMQTKAEVLEKVTGLRNPR